MYKWKHRDSFHDRSHTPRRLQTRLTPAQEAVAVALRRTLLISLDDPLLLRLRLKFQVQHPEPVGIGCCDGQTKQTPQQRGARRDFRRTQPWQQPALDWSASGGDRQPAVSAIILGQQDALAGHETRARTQAGAIQKQPYYLLERDNY